MNGNVVQTAQVGTVNFHGAAVPGGPERDEGQATGSSRDGGGCGWVVVVFLAVLVFLLSQCRGGSVFPEVSEPWPGDVRRDQVISTVFGGLRSCSRAVVLTPANCPQSEDLMGSGASNVTWALRGDPMDGVGLAYGGGKFMVSGSAVMTVSYEYPMAEPGFATKIVPYLAEVSSTGEELVSLEAVDPSRTPPVRKRRPVMDQDDVSAVLRSAFGRCAAGTHSAMPSDCPDVQVVGSRGDEHVRWGFAGDPVINTRATFDPESGLISVIGSYAAIANYVDVLGDQEISRSGTYWAKLVAEPDGLKVLDIETCNAECSK